MFKPLETVAEDKFYQYVKTDGNVCIKMNLRGRRGWPDRLIVLDYGYCFFIEFKREGEDAEPLQKYIHRELRKKGHKVYVIDNYKEAVAVYKIEKKRAREIGKTYLR